MPLTKPLHTLSQVPDVDIAPSTLSPIGGIVVEMKGEEFSRLFKQLQSCKGTEVHHNVSELKSAFESTTQSYIILRKVLSSYSNLDRAIWLGDNNHPERMNAFFLEVRRGLTSYLPAVRALTDYMERLSENEPPELKKEFEVRAADSVKSPLGCFFRSMANYLLHHRGLPIGVVIRGGIGKTDESYVKLDAKRLLEWSGWERDRCAKKAKKYIESQGEEIRILEKLEQYHQMVGQLFIWFHNELLDSHQAELEELQALQARMKSRGG